MIDAVRARFEQLEFGRRAVKGAIKALTPEQLALVPQGFANSIATLVVHIAAVEVNLSTLLSGQEAAEEVRSALLLDKYTPVPGVAIAQANPGETPESLTEKLDLARGILTEALSGLTVADLEREVPFGPGKTFPVTGLLNLLPFHLASHYGQIQLVNRFLREQA